MQVVITQLLVMTTNPTETIGPDVAPLIAIERQKKRTWLSNSHCTTTIVCTKHTYSILTNPILCWKEHLEAALQFFVILVSNAHSPWGLQTPPGFGPDTFFSVCLEIIGSGSIGGHLSRLRSSQMLVTLSSTISPDTQFAWNTLGMPPPQPSPLIKTHSRYLNPALTFMSLTILPHFPCLLLCLAAHFHSLSCLHPFCMCELGSQLPVHGGKLILFFCTYS